MKSFICPLHRQFLVSHPTHAYRYIMKAQQASEDCLSEQSHEEAYIWSAHALEAAQLVLDMEQGWSIPTIMQFTACCIEFCKLSQLTQRCPLSVLEACIIYLESLNELHQLHKIIWIQDCLYALRLQKSTLRQLAAALQSQPHMHREQQHAVMVH